MDNDVHQPKGNRFCMINFDSFNLANSSCKTFQCDTIAKYQHRGTFSPVYQPSTFIRNWMDWTQKSLPFKTYKTWKTHIKDFGRSTKQMLIAYNQWLRRNNENCRWISAANWIRWFKAVSKWRNGIFTTGNPRKKWVYCFLGLENFFRMFIFIFDVECQNYVAIMIQPF